MLLSPESLASTSVLSTPVQVLLSQCGRPCCPISCPTTSISGNKTFGITVLGLIGAGGLGLLVVEDVAVLIGAAGDHSHCDCAAGVGV